MSFRIRGISAAPFRPLFALSDAALAERSISRIIADDDSGFPCRVSLEHAKPGEQLLLLPFEHQPAPSPYRASGPIFVREAATAQFDRVGEIPEVLPPRQLSIRAYDSQDMMVEADVVSGDTVRTQIERFFAMSGIAYLHIHNAKRGCYSCRIDRA
jgi:hypothetical protein